MGGSERGAVAEGFVETNGVRLWYEQRGDPDGAPVVLVMGVGASAVWWPPDLVDALVEAGYRVVCFDSRDIGLSSHIDFASSPYGLDDMATDTVGLLAAIGIDRAHFVGVSLGGMICQRVALAHPDRVTSLTLVSSTPGPDERLAPPTDEFMAVVTRPAEPDADPAEGMVEFARVLAGRRFPFDARQYRELVDADVARGTNVDSSQGVVPASAPSRIDDLPAIRVPTLVVHGTEDPLFPYDHGEVLANSIPGATLVAGQGVGHEIPTQLVPELTDLLLDHLRAAA